MTLTIVKADDAAEAYDAVDDGLSERFAKAGEKSVRRITPGGLTTADLASGHALLLGNACKQEVAAVQLAAAGLTFGEGWFQVGEQRYDKPAQAVLCCVRNQADPGGVICAYYGNSPEAMKRSAWVTFYGGNSLVVFDNGRPVHRDDFERIPRVLVK